MKILPFIVHLPILLLIAFYLHKRYSLSPLIKIFWPALAFKLLAGIFIGIIYTYIYEGADTAKYQKYSAIITDLAKTNFQLYLKLLFANDYSPLHYTLERFLPQPRVLFTFKLLSILNLFTFSNYWLNSIYLSLFSFSGLWLLAIELQRKFKLSINSIALSLFFFPSFVLWSSGVMKESIVIGIIAFMLTFYISLIADKKFSLLNSILFVLFFLIGWKIKFYYTAILLCIMLSYGGMLIISKKISLSRHIQQNFLILALFLIFISIGMYIIPSLSFNYLVEIMYISYTNMISYSLKETYFTFSHLEPTFLSYLLHFPEATFTGLFRPFLWETHNFLSFFIGIENMLIMILFIGFLYQKIQTKHFSISPEAFALLVYIFITAALMAFIAPNWGTLSRYKAGYLMFWIILISENNPFIKKIKNIFKVSS